MSWVIGALAVVLGVVCAWGVISPRGQWRVLWSWSVSDVHADEPGGVAYGMRQLFSGLGLLAILVVAGGSLSTSFASQPRAERPPSELVQMWGTPAPLVIDRVISPAGAAPADLVEIPVLAYQGFAEDDVPDYLARLNDFSLLGNFDPPGYVGSLAPIGNAAMDFADLVLHVRGPILCIPRSVVVIETEEAVQVGVFYGLPIARDGSTLDSTEACSADATLTGSVLIPLQLIAPLGEREVQSLDGTALDEVPVLG